jgi:hypothetical protein
MKMWPEAGVASPMSTVAIFPLLEEPVGVGEVDVALDVVLFAEPIIVLRPICVFR